MMKRLSVFILLCAGISLSAQNIISTRPANAQDGKILTMEETILSRSLNPAGVRHKWENSNTQEFPKEILKGQSLYVAKAEGDTVAVAISENKQITYGQTVGRNEFGIDGGIFWSPDKTKLAFYRKDESKVTTFPLLDITTRTGSLVEIKYPMAGMDSENVQLGIYDVASGKVVYVNVDEFGYDQYLTNISWSPDASKVFIQVLDRSQKHIKLNMYDANDGSFIKTLLTEDNDRFVEPQDPIWFIKGSQNLFLYRTDNRDGYRNLYLCDLDGTVRRLTTVDADVHYVANDGKYVWYTSAEVSPIENHLFRVSIKVPKNAAVKGAEVVKFGKPERLTTEPGWHTISMSPDLTQYTDIWSSLCVPRMGNLCSSDGKVIENILIAEDPTLEYAYTEISLGTVKSADGKYDNYFRMIKPHNFDPTKKYPTIVYVYGGPHSQMVQNTFMGNLRRWEMYMAQRGYLVYVQDNRGTQNRGAEFEKAIHRQCGQAEMADQMEGVKMLMSLPYVDADRIGVHGWSYGGFMTISLITNYPEVFKVAVAGGPVIDWKWYEVMYGERYMDNPAVNPEGYAKTSLINKAKDLKGKLLICQGAIDPVVVWEHSLSFIRECIKNNVQVDYFPYPCAEHNVMGKDRVHLHDKISMYFEDYL
jgi:dipeptidyl-peptidase-4